MSRNLDEATPINDIIKNWFVLAFGTSMEVAYRNNVSTQAAVADTCMLDRARLKAVQVIT